MADRPPSYDLRPCSRSDVVRLCARFHGYGGGGDAATYAFAVFEDLVPVAGFLWQPPSHGAAKSVCPEAPQGVLSLSRMVAVPRAERVLNHISKPLRRQMRDLIDRTRWPALVTYHDEGEGHTGHVYKCSGWERTTRNLSPTFEDPTTGRRVAPTSSSAGATRRREMVCIGKRYIQRWEHWACPRGEADKFMADNGWVKVPIPGKTWRSGNQAYTFKNVRDIEHERQPSLF